MVRFDDGEWLRFLAMHGKSGVEARAVFLKAHFFGQPFRVLVTDKTLLDYCTKLSAFHAQYRMVGNNYNQVVKELRCHFSEKKAMALLYRLEQCTKELAAITRQVVELSREFQGKMVAKITVGTSLYGALAYNGMKVNEGEGKLLAVNKVFDDGSGRVDIARAEQDFKRYMPENVRTRNKVIHISLNPHPDDRLTDMEMEQLAREYLEKLGYGDQPYLIFKHEDINRHHLHIVSVNVDEHGRRLNKDFIHRRSKAYHNRVGKEVRPVPCRPQAAPSRQSPCARWMFRKAT